VESLSGNLPEQFVLSFAFPTVSAGKYLVIEYVGIFVICHWDQRQRLSWLRLTSPVNSAGDPSHEILMFSQGPEVFSASQVVRLYAQGSPHMIVLRTPATGPANAIGTLTGHLVDLPLDLELEIGSPFRGWLFQLIPDWRWGSRATPGKLLYTLPKVRIGLIPAQTRRASRSSAVLQSIGEPSELLGATRRSKDLVRILTYRRIVYWRESPPTRTSQRNHWISWMRIRWHWPLTPFDNSFFLARVDRLLSLPEMCEPH
jgi:hypothetical protein